MSYTTQCTQVCFGAAGSGASGSSTIIAKLFVPSGASDHASGGDVSAPSQVWTVGIAPFGGNADDVSVSAVAVPPSIGAASTAASHTRTARSYMWILPPPRGPPPPRIADVVP